MNNGSARVGTEVGTGDSRVWVWQSSRDAGWPGAYRWVQKLASADLAREEVDMGAAKPDGPKSCAKLNPTPAIDIYLVDGPAASVSRDPHSSAAKGAYAVTVPVSTRGSCTAFILLDIAATGTGRDMLDTTLTHELFHVLENAKVSGYTLGANWFTEASATWAQGRSPPTFATSHERGPYVLLMGTHEPRLCDAGVHAPRQAAGSPRRPELHRLESRDRRRSAHGAEDWEFSGSADYVLDTAQSTPNVWTYTMHPTTPMSVSVTGENGNCSWSGSGTVTTNGLAEMIIENPHDAAARYSVDAVTQDTIPVHYTCSDGSDYTIDRTPTGDLGGSDAFSADVTQLNGSSDSGPIQGGTHRYATWQLSAAATGNAP